MNNQAFVDGQNLTFSTRNADKPWKVDLRRFRVYLKERYHVEKAYYFIGYYIIEHADIYEEIQEAGFILVFRKHNEKMESVKKGNVDTDIVFKVMRKLVDREKFDKVVLVSGDGDYFRMVDYLVKKDRFAKLLAPNGHKMSSLYKLLNRRFYDFLDTKEIRKKIGRNKR